MSTNLNKRWCGRRSLTCSGEQVSCQCDGGAQRSPSAATATVPALRERLPFPMWFVAFSNKKQLIIKTTSLVVLSVGRFYWQREDLGGGSARKPSSSPHIVTQWVVARPPNVFHTGYDQCFHLSNTSTSDNMNPNVFFSIILVFNEKETYGTYWPLALYFFCFLFVSCP